MKNAAFVLALTFGLAGYACSARGAQPTNAGFTNLVSFLGNTNGAYPEAELLLSGNTLYGTTTQGGTKDYGTIFSVKTDGSGFTILYSFTGDSNGNKDGDTPIAGLVISGNTLYGTASQDGAGGYGVVFSIKTNGNGFTPLYSFQDGVDGANPIGTLVLSSNTLYGTTSQGGSNGYGTIFSINTDGTGFKALYSFNGNPSLNTDTNTAQQFGERVVFHWRV